MRKLIKKQIDILEKKGYKFITDKKEIFKRYNKLYFSFNIKEGVTFKQVKTDMQKIENVWF